MPDAAPGPAASGLVLLVGAGPGDPGLLTLAAKEAIDAADVIFYDKLVGPGILALLPGRAEKADVGKRAGSHPVPQEEINRLLLEHALRGKTVVRLKGGDPYLFGRGAEELRAIAARGIPFRVIPGVTSAIAAPACAGIPVTHRDCASSLHIFTGHAKAGAPAALPFAKAAALCPGADGTSGGTLVFLMGAGALAEICAGLTGAGLPETTPAALVENGTRPEQRRLSATLGTLAARAREETFGAPSVLVVGEVCALAETLDWTRSLPLRTLSTLPLRGKKILTVCSRTTSGRLAVLLRDRGGAVDEFAAVHTERIPQPPAFWSSLRQYAWIAFTSEFGVDCLFAGLAEMDLDLRAVAHCRFTVVGERTRETLARRGLRADFMPAEYSGRALGESLAGIVSRDEKVLLFRAASGADDLPAALRQHGIPFGDIAAYATFPCVPERNILDTLRAGGYDAVAFTSASAVDAFADAAENAAAQMPPAAPAVRAFCIGEATARAAARRGFAATAAPIATLAALADSIEQEI